MTESDNAVEVNKMNVSSRLKKFKILKGGLAIARRIESIIGEQCMNVKTGAPLYFSDVRGIIFLMSEELTKMLSTLSLIPILLYLKQFASSSRAFRYCFFLGCGRGRAVCDFARKHVRKVVGVESESLLCEAEKNSGLSLSGKQAVIEIHNIDAALEDISEGTVIFMFNPFGEQTLRMVLNNIQATLDVKVRPITVIYARPLHHYVFEEFFWLNVIFDYKSLNGFHVMIYRNQYSELSTSTGLDCK